MLKTWMEMTVLVFDDEEAIGCGWLVVIVRVAVDGCCVRGVVVVGDIAAVRGDIFSSLLQGPSRSCCACAAYPSYSRSEPFSH